MAVRCFFLEPLRQARLSLRRYSPQTESGTCPLDPGEYSYHNASTPLFDVPETMGFDEQSKRKTWHRDGPQERRDVPPEYIWPVACECGYEFVEKDEWQVFADSLYRRSDNGEIVTLRNAGPGAMWYAELDEGISEWVGPDGKSLHVNCPNGFTWHIDGRCSNCDSSCANCGQAYHQCQARCPNGYVDSRPHKCWLRSGIPPLITVGKTGGDGITCGAGGGSIQAGDYHGFLKAGVFDP